MSWDFGGTVQGSQSPQEAGAVICQRVALWALALYPPTICDMREMVPLSYTPLGVFIPGPQYPSVAAPQSLKSLSGSGQVQAWLMCPPPAHPDLSLNSAQCWGTSSGKIKLKTRFCSLCGRLGEQLPWKQHLAGSGVSEKHQLQGREAAAQCRAWTTRVRPEGDKLFRGSVALVPSEEHKAVMKQAGDAPGQSWARVSGLRA